MVTGGKPLKTYNEIYFAARKRLKEAGIDAFALEARLIVETAAGKNREEFLRDANLYVGPGYAETVDEMIRRRLNDEPVAYITGEWAFYGLPMNVSPDVLIPRADTELLAEKAIALLSGRDGGARVMDLCCGSGCVGIAIAANVPGTRVVFIDNAPKALAVCRANLMRNGLTRFASYVETDALHTPPMLIGRFDMIVCNPPYIPTADLKKLDRSVRNFEPLGALDGGKDGLDFYRAITKKWSPVLKPGGALLYECGIGQAQTVADLMRNSGYTAVTILKDTQGIDRVVAGMMTGGQENGREG